ncbi:MAG: FliM/FliN family flagellar motor switch protein [Paracoccaceae bacterium]|nr:FliM/FliN family flagellar motor switch protein [Paracoccaceae bacterium]
MNKAVRQDVLGQKAQAARRAYEARAMSPAKALRRAMSRTADVQWGLALVNQAEMQERLDQDAVTDALSAGDLLILLEGPGGALGLVTIDREVMTGVIEVQTILQVTQMPADDRPLTATDAAMMAPLIDGTLERFVANLGEDPLRPQLEGYSFGAMVEDARAASLLLEASSYRLFRVEADLALGRRKGVIQFIFPDRDLDRWSDAGEGQGAAGPHEARMKLLPARLDTVLGRINLPLNEARGLKPGDILPLPAGVMDGLELIAAEGKVIARGRLGQINGMRAVRLNWPPVASAPSEAPSAAMPDDAPAFDPPADPAPAAEPEIDLAPAPAPGSFAAEVDELPDLPPLDFDGGDFADELETVSTDLPGETEGGAEPDDSLGDFAATEFDFDFDET